MLKSSALGKSLFSGFSTTRAAFRPYLDGHKELLHEMIRVNQAGEIGANRIYEGQLYVLSSSPAGPLLKHMLEQEQKHLAYFNALVSQYDVRPTFLSPFWNLMGWSLGVVTALLGKEAAMACTEAVETVVGLHYNDQLRQLNLVSSNEALEEGIQDDFSLPIRPLAISSCPTTGGRRNDFSTAEELTQFRSIIKECRDEELEHLDTAIENDALKTPFYSTFTWIVKAACSTAIAVAKKI